MGQAQVSLSRPSRYGACGDAELRRLTARQGLTQRRCGGILEPERTTLIALLRAYDRGMRAAEGLEGLSDAEQGRSRANSTTASTADAQEDLVLQRIIEASGPKGVDIGGTLAKIALALPWGNGSVVEHQYPETFGLTGRTRPDLEFDFDLPTSNAAPGGTTSFRLRFVSGGTAHIEAAVAEVRRRKSLLEVPSGNRVPEKARAAVSLSRAGSSASLSSEGRASCATTACPSPDHDGSESDLGEPNVSGALQVFTAGGGAHKYAPLLRDALGVELVPVKELTAVVDGLLFLSRHGPRDRCLFTVGEHGENEPQPWPEDLFPLLLVNIGTGVSMLRVDDACGSYSRIGGTACGGGTFLGLARAMTSAESFADALRLAEEGDASKCDLLVSDIYGEEGCDSLGLPGTLTASNFGKFCGSGGAPVPAAASERDVARALLKMVTQQSALLSGALARQVGCVDRVFFVGGFVEEANWVARTSIAANFRNLGGKAYFLRHSDYLGSLGSLRACFRGEDVPDV